MAGQLTIDTLKASSGVLATQNGMTGICKAWCVVVSSTSPTISASFNVSSVTYTTAGDFNVNFTTSMPSANYATTATNSSSSTNNMYARATSASQTRVIVNGGANNDFSFAAFSS